MATPVSGPPPLESLELVLTADCNMRCGYCYQNEKKARSIEWDTARAALDRLLQSPAPQVHVRFIGGEPLLELPTIRRSVEYLAARAGAEREVSYAISTNGLLLDRETAAFLARHRFETQLSFDGVAAAQDLRGKGTHRRLDRVLDELRLEFPQFLRRHLCVSITLTGANLRHAAESFAYLVDKGVSRVRFGPLMTADPSWQPGDIEELDRQFRQIFELSLAHYQRTGWVLAEAFERTEGEAPDLHQPVDGQMCGAATGRGIAVDVDGEVSGCVTFAGSYQAFPGEFLRSRLQSMSMGKIRNPLFRRRLALYPEAAKRTGLFHDKASKYSSYRRCGECEYVGECGVCPVSIGHIPGNQDPNRVPDLPCAYNLTVLKYRRQFPARPGLFERLRRSPQAFTPG